MGHVRVRAPVHARLPARLRGRARKSSRCQAARLYEPVPPRLALARLFGGTGSMEDFFFARRLGGPWAGVRPKKWRVAGRDEVFGLGIEEWVAIRPQE